MKPASARSQAGPRHRGEEGCYLRSGIEWVLEPSYQPSPAPSPNSIAAKVSSLSIICLSAYLSSALSMLGVLSPHSSCPLLGRCSRLRGRT